MAIELLAGERKENETDKAVIACNDYLRLSVGRSLEKLCEYYRVQSVGATLTYTIHQSASIPRRPARPPTESSSMVITGVCFRGID